MWNGAQWVPNPYRPAAAGQWGPPYESARFRATMASVFLVANAVAVALTIGWDFLNIAYLQAERPDSAFTLMWGLLALAALGLAYGTLIPAIVFFCMWVHRVVRNMPALGSPDWRRPPGWSVGLSFVPIANLLYPYWAVLDAWRASDPRWRWLNLQARKALGVPALLFGWWALWLLANGASRVAYFMARYGDNQGKVNASLVDVAGAVSLIGAAALAILVIRDLTAQQELKHELIASGRLD